MIESKKKFYISERRMVKEFYALVYGPIGQNRYLVTGIPKDEFLKHFKNPALRRAVSSVDMNLRELESFKLIEFYLDSCIEQGFIKKDGVGNLWLTAEGHKLLRPFYWAKPEWVSLGIAFLSLIIAAYTGYAINAQVGVLQESKQEEAATLLININDQLRNGSTSYSKIISALANGESLKSFSDQEKDNYLVMWELIDQLVENNAIDINSAYDAFGYDIGKAYCSSDIKNFVLSVRHESSSDFDDYGGFTNLARKFLIQDNNSPCPADFITNRNF